MKKSLVLPEATSCALDTLFLEVLKTNCSPQEVSVHVLQRTGLSDAVIARMTGLSPSDLAAAKTRISAVLNDFIDGATSTGENEGVISPEKTA